MKRRHYIWLIPILIATQICEVPAAEFKFGNQILKVPDGFEIELVSDTSLVQRPVAMDFDEQGRLYVTDSSGSSDKGPTQYEKKDHRVMRLEDTDGDGVFDKSTTFADNMMFPEGCMWFDGSVYVGAPPSIWKLTDTNNDGIADVREEWHKGNTLTGCANDLHGPYLGPDGWIYWCKGAFSNQTYEVNSKPWSSRAAHIFRARPDHSGIEPVLTGGMDNPVAVAFSPEGERFLAGTFFEPGIPGRRDGVIHAIYGGVYGKQNDVLEGHKRTGDLMPVMTHLGASASCSLIFYRSKIFGDDFQNNMLVCNFNLHNVTRHVLEPDGATFKTKDSVFLSCDNDPDFHPTCVLEDADGSLLVIDTGGWYKICCPTSQLYKPDVLGAIYRIRKKGAQKVDDPHGLKIEWAKLKPDDLAQLLDDQRLYVRNRAVHELGNLGIKSVRALEEIFHQSENRKNLRSVEARRNAVWALTQNNWPEARRVVHTALIDQDETVRHAAIHSVSIWRDKDALARLVETLNGNNPQQLKRAAAEALGRLGEKHHNTALFVALEKSSPNNPATRVLEHSIIFALTEIGDAKSVQSTLNKAPQRLEEDPPPNPIGGGTSLLSKEEFRSHWVSSYRAALIALDQMDEGDLKPEQVTPVLLSKEKVLKETALWIVSHHLDWGSVLTGFFREQLAATNLTASDREQLQTLLAQFAGDAAIQDLLAATTRDSKSKDARLTALRAMSHSSLKQAPRGWLPTLLTNFGENDEAIVRASVAAIRALPPPNETNATPALWRLAHDEKLSADLRLEALAALPSRQTPLDDGLFSFLQANLDPQKTFSQRNTATFVLSRQKLSQKQLLKLTDALKQAGPMELPKLLSAYNRATNEEIGLRLVASLKDSKGVAALRAELLKPHLTNFPSVVQAKAEELFLSLNTDAQAQKKHIDEMLTELKGGDIRRGQAVFNGSKAACSTCHAIGYLGGHVGPDLTKIGTVRTERDLLESIVYPSASFVRSFEPLIVSTKSDEDYSGILKKDSPDEIILVTGPNAEVKIARNDIKDMRPGAVSVMPQGLDAQLTKQELADLVAFLKVTQW